LSNCFKTVNSKVWQPLLFCPPPPTYSSSYLVSHLLNRCHWNVRFSRRNTEEWSSRLLLPNTYITHAHTHQQRKHVGTNSDGHTPVNDGHSGALPHSLGGHDADPDSSPRHSIVVAWPESTLLFEVEQLSVKCHFDFQGAFGCRRLCRYHPHGRRRGPASPQSRPVSLLALFQGHFKGLNLINIFIHSIWNEKRREEYFHSTKKLSYFNVQYNPSKCSFLLLICIHFQKKYCFRDYRERKKCLQRFLFTVAWVRFLMIRISLFSKNKIISGTKYDWQNKKGFDNNKIMTKKFKSLRIIIKHIYQKRNF
jgi:hypothetical protein